MFAEVGAELPSNIRVSCGWTSVKALAPNGGSRRIGECWPSACSADSAREVFVSPCLEDVVLVLGTLAHELVHAWNDCKDGHKGPFRRIAIAIGLEGKMTSTKVGEQLRGRLLAIAAKLGPYPHRTLDASASGRKKQSTRMIKVVCPDCGYTVRTTRQWIEQGLPTCACGTDMRLPGDEETNDE